jgi:hypothetical protein
MERSTTLGCFALLLCACGGEPPPAASGTDPTAKPEAPAPAKAAAPADPAAPNPCANPTPITLQLEAGVPQTTPFGLELTYAIEDDGKREPGYVFLLRSGSRRWETRRNASNWSSKQTWRGFCWRGGERPERRASKLQIQVAPVCSNGQLVEVGGCGDALGPT